MNDIQVRTKNSQSVIDLYYVVIYWLGDGDGDCGDSFQKCAFN